MTEQIPGLDSGQEPAPTGDPAADAILEKLRESQDMSPEEEIEVYREALTALRSLMDDQPRLPGAR